MTTVRKRGIKVQQPQSILIGFPARPEGKYPYNQEVHISEKENDFTLKLKGMCVYIYIIIF